MNSRSPYDTICVRCLHTLLPFFITSILNTTPEVNEIEISMTDYHLQALNENKHLLKISHIVAQSLISPFAEFEVYVVGIPGFKIGYKNSEKSRGG